MSSAGPAPAFWVKRSQAALLLCTQSLRPLKKRAGCVVGHFVEGLAGPQFAWPAAVEQLRAVAQESMRQTLDLSLGDPICTCWLQSIRPKLTALFCPGLLWLTRRPPNHDAKQALCCCLRLGSHGFYLEPKGQGITTFASLWAEPCRERLQAAVAALRPWARQHAGQVAVWRQIDGQAALRHPPPQKIGSRPGCSAVLMVLSCKGQAPDNGFGALPSQKRGD